MTRRYRVRHVRLADATGLRAAGTVVRVVLADWLVDAPDVRTALDAVRDHVKPLRGEMLITTRSAA